MIRWVGLAWGIAAGAVSLIISVYAAGAGHGSYIPAVLLFPYTMLTTRVTGVISPFAIVLAAIQFPLYGIAIARAGAAGRRRRTMGLILVHGAGVLAAFVLLRGDDSF